MAILSPITLALVASAFCAVILFRRWTSPLWKIPGPFLSGFMSLELKYNELRANRTLYIHGLHVKYGPIVRIAPDEVSFTSWAALKEIYTSSGSGYDKTEFYDLFKIYGRRSMFTTLNKADHAKRKRILADRYANTNIMRPTSLDGIQERSKRFIQRCTGTSPRVSDVFMALHAYACDCVTHHLFHPSGTNCLQNPEDEKMMEQVAGDDSLQNRLIFHYSPVFHRLVSGFLSYFGTKPRETPLADNYVMETATNADPALFTLLSRLREKSGNLDDIDAAAECLDHMAAGIDTTGDGLCFLMWELSQPRSLKFQKRLIQELRKNRDGHVDQLPFLDAIIQEGLRCYAPIPMSLPRYVPKGGRSIDGVFLPQNTIVSCQGYSVHRINEDIFPEPERFNPERWLDPEGDAERRRLMFAFSNGGRGCVGKHLALAEMKTLLRDVYSNFSTTPDASMTEEMMTMADQLVSTRPRSEKCLLVFHPLRDESTGEEV